jgi:hypothetical protein
MLTQFHGGVSRSRARGSQHSAVGFAVARAMPAPVLSSPSWASRSKDGAHPLTSEEATRLDDRPRRWATCRAPAPTDVHHTLHPYFGYRTQHDSQRNPAWQRLVMTANRGLWTTSFERRTTIVHVDRRSSWRAGDRNWPANGFRLVCSELDRIPREGKYLRPNKGAGGPRPKLAPSTGPFRHPLLDGVIFTPQRGGGRDPSARSIEVLSRRSRAFR